MTRCVHCTSSDVSKSDKKGFKYKCNSCKKYFNIKIGFWGWTWRIILLLIIISVVMGAIQDQTGSSSKTTQVNEQTTYGLGDRIVLGNTAYTINNISNTQTIGSYVFGSLIGKKADGVYLVVDLTVENIGTKSDQVWSWDNIKIIDNQSREFSHDVQAEIYLPSEEQMNFGQLQPGLPKRGELVFDIPLNTRGAIKISQGGFSDKSVLVVPRV